jgi:hypothetical protein
LTIYSVIDSREWRRRGAGGKGALNWLAAVAGVWAIVKVRSNVVSGTPRAMAGTATTKKALRMVNWRLKPAGPCEATPPIRGGPQVVVTETTE